LPSPRQSDLGFRTSITELNLLFTDKVFELGAPGDKPFAGDFNGKGVDTVGVYHETPVQARAPQAATVK
jgi:hypothetical protein